VGGIRLRPRYPAAAAGGLDGGPPGAPARPDGSVAGRAPRRGPARKETVVATIEQCRTALDRVAETLGGGDNGSNLDLDRSLSCRVTDLDTTFSGHLRGGHLEDITTEQRPPAQIRFTTKSDDLVALADGQLHFAKAWASGRLKVEASLRDLFRLRSLA
jgi:hypothetical protein